MSEPNFNINFRVDKAMEKISESKALRKWTYFICFLAIIAIAFWKSSNIIASVADLIRAMNGR